MRDQTADFKLEVAGVKGLCPVGEAYAKRQIAEGTTPVLSCEGPCVRGDIARRAADMVARQPSLARACHGETFFVPHSAMASWVKGAERVLMIDGCFLECHGRVLKAMVPEERIVRVDALSLYRRYTDVFLMDDVPEEGRTLAAREVADKVIAALTRKEKPAPCGCEPAGCSQRQEPPSPSRRPRPVTSGTTE